MSENGLIYTNGHNLLDLFGALPSASGCPVDYQHVWNIAPFHRGCDLISSKMGTIDLDVLKDVGGNKEEYYSHPAYHVLRRYAAPWLPSSIWIANIIKDALWAGNGYSMILRNTNPIQLMPLDPRQVQPWITRDLDTFEVKEIYYRVTMHGVEKHVPFADMIHVKGMTECGALWGMPLLDYCKDVLGLCLGTIRYGSAYFRSAATPGMIIELPSWLKDKKQKEEFEATLNKAPGPDEAWKTTILQNSAKAVFPPAVSNESAQFLGSMEQAAIIASQILGLPSSKLGARSQNSSYNSLSADELSIYKDTYNRWMSALEDEVSNKLLTEKEKASGIVSIQFNRHQLLEGDTAQTLSLIQQQVEIGLLNANEGRALLNRPKISHPNAEKHRMPSHSVFIEDVVKPDPGQSTMQVEGKPQTPEILDQQPPSDHQQRGLQMTEISVSRLIARLKKAGKDFRNHKEVMLESLAPFERSKQWIDGLLDELDNVLPEQYASVLDNVKVKDVARKLWTN